MSAPLVFIDTETDGVHPDRKAWEIAMIRRDDERTIGTHMFVEIDLSTADPFGLKVGGFYDRHPLGQAISEAWRDDDDHKRRVKTQREAALKVAQITHGAHLVGAVPHFDAEVLANLLRSQGLTPSWHYHLIDVEAMAVGYLSARRAPIAPPWKSDDLGRQLGINPPSDDQRHTAMGDAEWAMRWYDAMTGSAA